MIRDPFDWRIIVLGLIMLFYTASFSGKHPAPTDDLFVKSDTLTVWIFLNKEKIPDKQKRAIRYSEKANRRLEKSRQGYCDTDEFIPSDSVLNAISRNVLKIRHYSKMLTAVSATITREQCEEILELNFVEKILPVATLRRIAPEEEVSPITKGLSKNLADSGFYGPSYRQLSQLNIPAVHDSGLTGKGVRIAIFDTGFRKSHVAFQKVIEENRLVAERDFIFNDNNVDDEIPEDTTREGNQNSHGTMVWSEIAAYDSGKMIGAAYGAEFVLAKTERLGSETPIEEDNYVAAVEWADSLGVDIISTSLGYRDFDDFKYSFGDLDGESAITTQAVNWAFQRGIVVVVAAGNDGTNFPDGGLGAPADAYGSLSVGAVYANGTIAEFSSHGPTVDGRIKPDVCAMGVSAFLALNDGWSYGYCSGTSVATPLIAGSAALILEKHPDWSPAEVIREIKHHSSKSDNPDYQYGWGIPDVWKTIFEYKPVTYPPRPQVAEEITCFPNPTRSEISLFFVWENLKPSTESAKLEVINLRGELVWSTDVPVKWNGIRDLVYWDLKNDHGQPVSSGIYWVRLLWKNEIKCGKMTILR